MKQAMKTPGAKKNLTCCLTGVRNPCNRLKNECCGTATLFDPTPRLQRLCIQLHTPLQCIACFSRSCNFRFPFQPYSACANGSLSTNSMIPALVHGRHQIVFTLADWISCHRLVVHQTSLHPKASFARMKTRMCEREA